MRSTFISLIFTLVVSAPCIAQIPGLTPQKDWNLDGYIDYRVNHYWLDDASSALEQSIQQRFNYEYRVIPNFRFNAAMRNRVVYGDTVQANGFAQWYSRDNGYFDLSHNWSEKEELVANTQLDRVYLTWQDRNWLAQAGRFRINWGMTTIWNPNDVFNTYSVYDTQYIERPGTDGLLLRRQLSFASNIELAFSPSKQGHQQRYASRYTFNYGGWDGQFIGGKSRFDRFVGLGFSGDIKGAGVRGESSYFTPDDHGENEPLGETTITSLETDYSFISQSNWMVKFGLLHTSNPQIPNSSADYFTHPLSTRTLSFTRLTGYAETGFDLTPLNRSTFSVIYYQDHSVYFTYSNQYSIADNWQLTASIQHFDGPETSLFGASPTTNVYASIRWDW